MSDPEAEKNIPGEPEDRPEPDEELRSELVAFARTEGLLMPTTDEEVRQYEAGEEPLPLPPHFVAEASEEVLQRIRQGHRPPLANSSLPFSVKKAANTSDEPRQALRFEGTSEESNGPDLLDQTGPVEEPPPSDDD